MNHEAEVLYILAEPQNVMRLELTDPESKIFATFHFLPFLPLNLCKSHLKTLAVSYPLHVYVYAQLYLMYSNMCQAVSLQTLALQRSILNK